MVTNITSIGDAPKDAYKEFHLEITYTDATTEKLECTFFGSSMDNEDFMVFAEGPPDDESYPTILINSAQIRRIKILNVVEIEK